VVVGALLAAGARVDLSARDGATVLFLAARSGHADLLPSLLLNGPIRMRPGTNR
jgi:hypothetical protein